MLFPLRQAVPSMNDAFLCRAVGKWASQHAALQKISLRRPELHAVTEQRTSFVPAAIFFLHMQQTVGETSGMRGA
jgi:hypothetical protein